MCGIAGWIAPPAADLGPETLTAMLDALAHRGPDGCGQYRVSAGEALEVALGHRRLAIIDPEGARQPMIDAEAGLALVFNGEIYNFRALRAVLARHGYVFQRDSDTEVLLRAYQHWGEDVVLHLRGMFAFAVWDARRRSLFLARDRFGEKPLFLRETRGGLFFASEIKALRRLPGPPPSVDLAAVRDLLAWRYVPGPATLLTGIRKLMPGTAAVLERGRLREWRYWTPPDRLPLPARKNPPDDAECIEEFTRRLDEAVRLQMVSDVPFGAFLSGGLDSSMIVALMSRHCPAVRTFSVGFADDRDSELPHAALVARRFGSVHQDLIVGAGDIMAHLPALIAHRDAPVSEPSDIAIHLMAREAARSVRMVLTGEGSDEILGGYPKHLAERYLAPCQRLPAGLRQRLFAPLARALPYSFRRAKTLLANLGLDEHEARYVRWFGALTPAERDALLALPLPPQLPGGSARPPFDSARGNSALRRILYFDQTSWLPDNLLERGDRMTMAASLEARMPFLDPPLAEYVSGLPDHYRVRGLTSKWLLREAGRRLLPPSIPRRAKIGFRVPVHRWFRHEMRDYLCDHLQSTASHTRHYYDPHSFDRLLGEHLSGRQNHEKLLWTLLNLELWHRHHAA